MSLKFCAACVVGGILACLIVQIGGAIKKWKDTNDH